jgi:hypothetical protein
MTVLISVFAITRFYHREIAGYRESANSCASQTTRIPVMNPHDGQLFTIRVGRPILTKLTTFMSENKDHAD